jgi:phosphate transport system permease protein
VAVLGLLLLIGWRGLVYFWPHPIYEWQLEDASGNKSVLIGEINDRSWCRWSACAPQARRWKEDREEITRYLVKTGNREFVDLDFRWVLETDIKSRTQPAELAMVERATNGNFYGYITSVKEDGQELTTDLHPALQRVLARANGLSPSQRPAKGAIGSINYQLERLRLKERKAELDDKLTDQLKAELASERQAQRPLSGAGERALLPAYPGGQRQHHRQGHARRAGDHAHVPVLDVVWPNDMSLMAKVGHWFHQIGKFVSDDPGRRTPGASSRPSSAPSSW